MQNIESESGQELFSIYDGQTRIIPSDQLERGAEYLKGKIGKLSNSSGNAIEKLSGTYKETFENLADRLKGKSGCSKFHK